jgi:hypothetical protein
MANWLESNREQKCRECRADIEVGQDIYRRQPGVYLCTACGQKAESEPRVLGDVEQAVEDDLARMPGEARKTVIAQTMLKLARQIDADDVGTREMFQYTKELRLMFMQLRDLFPEHEENDPTQKAREDRERRMREGYGI